MTFWEATQWLCTAGFVMCFILGAVVLVAGYLAEREIENNKL
jgi:hypothetical protein